MGARFTRNTRGPLDGSEYFRMAEDLIDIYAEELADAGADGVLEARSVIETSGTGRDWTGPFMDRSGTIREGSGPGRIDTGEMLNAIDFRVVKGKTIGLDVGWTSIWEVYFAAQDQGFDAPGYRHANQAVAGMGVISHLKVYMRGKVDEALDRAEERIINGL